jgi:C1A family cysteine protease
MSKYCYGWRGPYPGAPYPTADPSGLMILGEVDPRLQMPSIFDQLKLGTCTANATAACFEYDAILDGHDCGKLSRLWIYYFERVLEGTVSEGDVGAYGHDAFKVAQHGIPDESLWPYIEAKYNEKPADIEPRAYTLKKPVHTVPQNEGAIRAVLSNKQTIAFGFTVYDSFEDESWWPSAKMPVPRKGENSPGGHEIDIVGFLEDDPDYFIARNSWNLIYGLFGDTSSVTPAEAKARKGGYFLFPKAVLLDPNMCSDFRTIVRSI